MYKYHTRLNLIEGGNRFKQGDRITLAFAPLDYKGEAIDLTGKQINGMIYSTAKGVIYEKVAAYDAERKLILFSIDETVDYGTFQVEFTVTDSANSNYRLKIPSDPADGRINILGSADNMDFVGVKMTTVAQLRNEQVQLQQEFASQVLPRVNTVEGKQTQLEADYQAAAGALTEDSEVILARKGEPTLRAFNDKVVAQLADKVGGGKRATLNDLSPEVLGAIEAGEGAVFELLSEPAPNSVTFEKLNYEVSSFLDRESVRNRLMGSSIEGARQQVTFNTTGDLEKVEFVDGRGVVQRTDSFTYGDDLIIESRTLASGASVTFEHDLNTLETSEYIQERIQLVTQPMSVTSTTDGWVYNKSSASGETATLSGGSAAVTYNSPDFKATTPYGFLFEVSANNLTEYLRTSPAFTGAYERLVYPSDSGAMKFVLTTTDPKPAGVPFQLLYIETGSVAIGNIRIFELAEQSQVKYDFENLTAAELNTKYPKELN